MSLPPFDVQTILTGLGYETHSYSGREMYGKECLSIHSDSAQDVLLMIKISDLIRDRYGLSVYKALDIRQDRLGKGYVIYFPDIPFIEVETPQ